MGAGGVGGGGDRRRAALVVLIGVLGSAVRAGAAVTVTASRSELFFSADANPDCSKLSKQADAELPRNVVRIHAAVDGGAPAGARYRWALPRPLIGTLAADLDLGPADQTAAVRGLCSEFGNACVLTEDKLPFYNQPTILWVAPTCETLPTKTTSNFRGATVKIGLTVTSGRRKLGRQAVAIGYGRAAAITLFADGRDGVGVPGGIPSDIQPFLGAIVDPRGTVLPPPKSFDFDSGGGQTASVTGCTDPQLPDDTHVYDACVGTLLYRQAGRVIARVTEKFDDGSALCDNITIRVLSAHIIPRLEVKATPRGPYAPGDPVRGTAHLTVTLHNDSPRQGGSGILLTGSGVLTCSAEVKITGTTDTSQTTFDLQHCSQTTGQACRIDAHCQAPFCDTCTVNETCLTQSHCSKTLDRLCSGDVECRLPACSNCEDGETCVQVLAVPQIVVGIGRSVVLVDKDVALVNDFPTAARVKDTWVVNTFNAGSDDAKLHYSIRGKRPAGP